MSEKLVIENVAEEWIADSSIDESYLIQEIIRTTTLHSKYLSYFIDFKREVTTSRAILGKMGNMKRKYYRGECTKNDLDKYGWTQYQGLKPSLSEMNSLLEYDIDMINLRRNLNTAELSVQSIEYIMKQISQRDYTLKNLFEVHKYLNGA